jgi:Uri superfamily endonuclease
MDLPEQKGTYVLLLQVTRMRRLMIGRSGTFDFQPGFYAYVGSAFGAGGLRARVAHHLAAVAVPHWHIDYLMGLATPLEVWYAVGNRKLERDWVEMLERERRCRCPIPRFGSSDYRRSRTSHLFFTKRRPSFGWFEQRVQEVFEAEIKAQCATVKGDGLSYCRRGAEPGPV